MPLYRIWGFYCRLTGFVDSRTLCHFSRSFCGYNYCCLSDERVKVAWNEYFLEKGNCLWIAHFVYQLVVTDEIGFKKQKVNGAAELVYVLGRQILHQYYSCKQPPFFMLYLYPAASQWRELSGTPFFHQSSSRDGSEPMNQTVVRVSSPAAPRKPVCIWTAKLVYFCSASWFNCAPKWN